MTNQTHIVEQLPGAVHEPTVNKIVRLNARHSEREFIGAKLAS
jgi:hypothetical protein